MAVSREFIQAVNEKNVLRIRLMLKNSLLLDTSFQSFNEMEKIAGSHGINVWMEPAEQILQKKPKPWNMDDMNYEITAVVNDFTKEHVKYLMDMIREVYVPGIYTEERRTMYQDSVQSVRDVQYKNNNGMSYCGTPRCYRQILHEVSRIKKAVKDKRFDRTRKLSTEDIENIAWTDELINEIRDRAQKIVNYCDEVQEK